jgi:ketosteroid isomerase-like protein
VLAGSLAHGATRRRKMPHLLSFIAALSLEGPPLHSAARSLKPQTVERWATRWHQAWNAHNVTAMRRMLAPNATFYSFANRSFEGPEAIMDEMRHVFKKHRNISAQCESVSLHVSSEFHRGTARCEALVEFHNAAKTVQHVVKVLTFNDRSKIVRLYTYLRNHTSRVAHATASPSQKSPSSNAGKRPRA